MAMSRVELPTPQQDPTSVLLMEGGQVTRKRKAREAGASSSASSLLPIGVSVAASAALSAVRLAELAPLVSAVADEGAEPVALVQGLTRLRQAMAVHSSPPIQELIAVGGLPPLVARLAAEGTSALARLECAWVLTNAASGTSEQTTALLNAGAVGAAITALGSEQIAERHELCDQLLWLLGNIAADADSSFRDVLLNDGVLSTLGFLFSQMPAFSWSTNQRAEVLRTLTWLMSSLCRGDPAPAINEVDCCFEYFGQVLIGTDDAQMLFEALWGLCHLLDPPASAGDADRAARARRLLSVGVDPAAGASALAGEPNPLLLAAANCARRAAVDKRCPLPVPALRLLGLLLASPACEAQAAALVAGAVPAMRLALGDAKAPEEVRRDAAWAVANSAAGEPAQAAAVLTSDPAAWAALCEAATDSEAPWSLRRESAWAVVNLVKQLGFASEGTASPMDPCRTLDVVAHALRARNSASAGAEFQRAMLDAAEAALRHGDELGRAQGLDLNPVAVHGEEVGLPEELEELQAFAEDAGAQRKAAFVSKWFAVVHSENCAEGGRDSILGGEKSATKGGAGAGDKSPSAAARAAVSAISGTSPTRKAAYRFGA